MALTISSKDFKDATNWILATYSNVNVASFNAYKVYFQPRDTLLKHFLTVEKKTTCFGYLRIFVKNSNEEIERLRKWGENVSLRLEHNEMVDNSTITGLAMTFFFDKLNEKKYYKNLRNKFIYFMLSKESPFRSFFEAVPDLFSLVLDKQGNVAGIIIHNTKVNSKILMNLLMMIRDLCWYNYANTEMMRDWQVIQELGYSPVDATYLLGFLYQSLDEKFISINLRGWCNSAINSPGYYAFDMKKWKNSLLPNALSNRLFDLIKYTPCNEIWETKSLETPSNRNKYSQKQDEFQQEFKKYFKSQDGTRAFYFNIKENKKELCQALDFLLAISLSS